MIRHSLAGHPVYGHREEAIQSDADPLDPLALLGIWIPLFGPVPPLVSACY